MQGIFYKVWPFDMTNYTVVWGRDYKNTKVLIHSMDKLLMPKN